MIIEGERLLHMLHQLLCPQQEKALPPPYDREHTFPKEILEDSFHWYFLGLLAEFRRHDKGMVGEVD